MDIQTLTEFFKWCTIINAALLVMSIAMYMAAPDFLYRTQSRFFPISRATFDSVFYGFLGAYKIVFLVFNAVPYIALLIIA